MDADLLKLRYVGIDIESDLVKNVATPAILEARIKRHHKPSENDFMFLEWEKLTEDILITSERTALINGHTSEKLTHLI